MVDSLSVITAERAGSKTNEFHRTHCGFESLAILSIASATEGAGCAGGWASRYALSAVMHARRRKTASLAASGTMSGMRGELVEDMGTTSGA